MAATRNDGRKDERHDEIDPELVALWRTRRGLGPVLAASVLVLCAYLLITLRADFVFALRGKIPIELGTAHELAAKGWPVTADSYVALTGSPDRSAPARLRGKQDRGHRVVPVLGTSRHLWLHVEGEPLSARAQYDERYTGRLRRLSSLGFADGLRAFFAALPPQPRFVDPASIAKGAPTVDVAGDALAVTPDAPVEIDERIEGVARVTVVASDPIKDEAGARAALVAAGLAEAPGPDPVSMTRLSWTYDVDAPNGVDAVRAEAGTAKFYAATVENKVERRRATWKDVAFDAAGGAIRVTGVPAAIPLDHTLRLAVYARTDLPDDAWILLDGEAPATYWYVLPLFGVLGLVSALMVWAIARGLRTEKKPPALSLAE